MFNFYTHVSGLQVPLLQEAERQGVVFNLHRHLQKQHGHQVSEASAEEKKRLQS